MAWVNFVFHKLIDHIGDVIFALEGHSLTDLITLKFSKYHLNFMNVYYEVITLQPLNIIDHISTSGNDINSYRIKLLLLICPSLTK